MAHYLDLDRYVANAPIGRVDPSGLQQLPWSPYPGVGPYFPTPPTSPPNLGKQSISTYIARAMAIGFVDRLFNQSTSYNPGIGNYYAEFNDDGSVAGASRNTRVEWMIGYARYTKRVPVYGRFHRVTIGHWTDIHECGLFPKKPAFVIPEDAWRLVFLAWWLSFV